MPDRGALSACHLKFTAAEKIVLVQDSLSTHAPASLHAAFEPAEARRSSSGSNDTESPGTAAGSIWPSPNWQLSPATTLTAAAACHAIAVRTVVVARRTRQNTHSAKANWRFTATDARVKLKTLYPALWRI